MPEQRNSDRGWHWLRRANNLESRLAFCGRVGVGLGNILSTAPDRFEPVYRRKPNRDVDARPWCRGFYASAHTGMP
jgi:hypothetical protein